MAAPARVEPPTEPAAEQEAAEPHRTTRSEATGPDVPRGTVGGAVTTVATSDLHPNPLQPRKRFREEALLGLAASLKAEGLIQPLTVRPRDEGGFEIVAGERRWRAAGLAGLQRIDVVVRPLSDAVAARWALIENLQREDLNPIERAEALQSLCDTQALNHAEVAEAIGLSRPTISNLLRLLLLSGGVRQLVADGTLRMGHARALAGIADAAEQLRLADRCVAENWSARRVEEAVRAAAAGDTPPRARAASPGEVKAAWLRDLEGQLTSGLETPVRVTPGRKRGVGAITLEYRSLEDFDRLLARLGVRTG